jgi:hypothetical protein
MAANAITPVLKDISEQTDRLEMAVAQLDAARSFDTAGDSELSAAHTAAVLVAAKLTKAASAILLLCRDIDSARREI